jgi:ubiquinone/menaquinone biosynthesis C-methylase UbiE
MIYMKQIAPVIHGCDISEAMLKANPADPSVLRKASAYELPYADASFDLVYCWELLHHVDRPLDAVKEMKRVAKKCVILCEPNSFNPAMLLFGLLVPVERGLLKFTPSYTPRLLIDSGLQNVAHFDTSFYTPNQTPYSLAKFLSRLPYKVPYFGLYSINVGYKA